MSSSLELRVDNFDSLYHGIQDSIDEFHHIGTGYLEDMSKHQFDTDHGLSPYLTVPDFDSPLSNLSSGPSSFPTSCINTPVVDNWESDSGSDSDSDVEPLSLSDENKFTIVGDVAYPTSNVHNQTDQDMPYVPPTSPAHPQALVHSKRRRTQTKVVAVPVYSSDDEADFESDGGDATEDEYIPTPPLNPLKRRRSVETSASSPSPPPKTSSTPHSQSTKRQRTSRDGYSTQTSSRGNRPKQWTAEDDKKWRCPHQPCDHRQWNKRGPDFRRHQRTHTRDSEASPYVCWGVLLEQAGASKKPIPGPTDKKRGVAKDYQGVMRIGGCFASFSRLDALKRHLETTKRGKECATDFDDFRGVSDD